MSRKEWFLIVFLIFLGYCYIGRYGLAIERHFSLGAEERSSTHVRPCRMQTCFDYAKCSGEFLVYVYPTNRSAHEADVLTAIRESGFYTPDASKACLFALGIDSMESLESPFWNNGRNHLIFNSLSTPWPEDFDVGEAILVSGQRMRAEFDVYFPEVSYSVGKSHVKSNKTYLLSVKEDSTLETICLQDSNATCKDGVQLHSSGEYGSLLQKSTFCLPRKPQQFIYALQAGCVPVVLSKGWSPPFQTVVDWTQAAVFAEERLLLQIPVLLRSIPASQVEALRQRARIYWERYFASLEKIVLAVLEVVRKRVIDSEASLGNFIVQIE